MKKSKQQMREEFLKWLLANNYPTLSGMNFNNLADYWLNIIDQQQDSLREKIEEKYGKFGSQHGSLGYQGIIRGIQSFQTETDIVRDYVLALLNKE